MKDFSSFLRKSVKRWRLQLSIGAGVLVLFVLYTFRLGSLPGKLSAGELQVYQQNSQLSHFTDRPLSMGYKVLDLGFLHVAPHSTFAARVTSVLIAILAVVIFFMILYRWHGRRAALLGTALFAPSSWILHVGRLGTPHVVWLLIPLVLILLGSWLQATEHHKRAVFALLGAFVWLLFTAGGLWFALAFAILMRRKIAEHLKRCGTGSLLSVIVLAILALAALAFSLYLHSSSVHSWLGLPQQLPSPIVALRQWCGSAVYLFVRGPHQPELWLAHTPILDVFTGAICLLGTYFYATHYKNLRSQTLAVIAFLGSVFVALNGPAAMSFIVPLAYLVAATGVTYLLREWLKVFPRNPLARGIGISLLTIAIVCAVTYNLGAYFVAWSHSSDTVRTFHQNLIQ